MRSVDGRVWVEDSVDMPRAVTGKELRDHYVRDVRALTLGLVRVEDNALRFGSLEILRFGRPKVTRWRVDWPIESGLAAGAPGGVFTVRSAGGRLEATLKEYRPRIPVALYAVTQLPIHHLVTRLHLLRVRGRVPTPGSPADTADRLRAGAIDVVLCTMLAMTVGRGRRLRAIAGVAAVYHIACWGLFGRTLGGAVTGLRVVAVDGSRPSFGQALVRFAALPIAALQRRAVHDQAACTEVIAG